jgi:hypothetical protein
MMAAVSPPSPRLSSPRWPGCISARRFAAGWRQRRRPRTRYGPARSERLRRGAVDVGSSRCRERGYVLEVGKSRPESRRFERESSHRPDSEYVHARIFPEHSAVWVPPIGGAAASTAFVPWARTSTQRGPPGGTRRTLHSTGLLKVFTVVRRCEGCLIQCARRALGRSGSGSEQPLSEGLRSAAIGGATTLVCTHPNPSGEALQSAVDLRVL